MKKVVCANCSFRFEDSRKNICPICGYRNPKSVREQQVKREKKEKTSLPKDFSWLKNLIVYTFLSLVILLMVCVILFLVVITFNNLKENRQYQLDTDSNIQTDSSFEFGNEVNDSENDSLLESFDYESETVDEAFTFPTPVVSNTNVYIAAVSDDYVFSDSSSRYIEANELLGLSSEQLRIARNEIYARHGRKFKDEGLDEYFRSKHWYIPLYTSDEFDIVVSFNNYESENIRIIKEEEQKR